MQTTTEKRRSFPTMQTELALSKANQQAEKEGSSCSNRGGNNQQKQQRNHRNDEGGRFVVFPF
jgi:hypothetical protein